MNFGDPSAFGTEMADSFVASGANFLHPVSNRVNPISAFFHHSQTPKLITTPIRPPSSQPKGPEGLEITAQPVLSKVRVKKNGYR